MAAAFAQQFAWGGLVLASFIGWGGVLHLTLGRQFTARPDWGLRAGWGMALALAIGGGLSALGLMSVAIAVGFVIVGVILAVAFLSRQGFGAIHYRGWSLLVVIGIAIPLLTRYAAAVHYQAMSCGDDDIAYFPMIVRLLQTGTLIEPFSLRRLAGYGGHTFLQSLVVATGTEANAYLMDRGIALVAAFGLVLGLFRDRASGDLVPVALALLLVVLMPFPLLNSHSHLTGLVLFLTLLRSLDHLRETVAVNVDWRSLLLLGAVVAGTASLRAHFSVAAAIAVAAFWWLVNWRDGNACAASSRNVIGVGAAALLILSPWIALLQRSSGSWLYPVFRGNHRADFENYSQALVLTDQMAFLADVFTDPRMILFMLPMALYAFKRPSRAGLAFYIASLVTALMLTWTFTYSDAQNIHRYVAPFLNVAFIATLVAFLDAARHASPNSARGRSPGNILIVATVLALAPVMMFKDIRRLADNWGYRSLALMERTHYVGMQAAVPERARVLTAIDHPFVLDFRRNDIANVDVPGAASPDPGMPFFKGAEALKRYLLDQGISHVAFRDFQVPGGCLYNRRLWEFHRNGPSAEWRMASRFYLDFMDNIETLTRSTSPLFNAGGLIVIKL